MRLLKQILISIIIFAFASAQNISLSDNDAEKEDYVYILHGFAQSKWSMKLLSLRLEKAGFVVERIGYKSLNRSPKDILRDITEQINADLPDTNYTVHFVGQSLGGLMIRAYLDSNRIANLGRVVLIGTPNQGTPVVDKYRDSWWMKILGPMPRALGTDANSFPNSIDDPYYPVGIIAGNMKIEINEEMMPGEDDGIVPLKSTILEAMTDMVIIETNHIFLPKSLPAAKQTIAFLRTGRFIKDELEN
ncbi:MAG: hypothetical protein JW956_06145 [Calditrichaceae bacterium]|nr:hypothetical protein [Calditrichaceae bacterium]HES59660.1 alpha/beta hydrolase [Caldithrix sp.]